MTVPSCAGVNSTASDRQPICDDWQVDRVSPRLFRLGDPVHSSDRAVSREHAAVFKGTRPAVAAQIEPRARGHSDRLAFSVSRGRNDRTNQQPATFPSAKIAYSSIGQSFHGVLIVCQ